MSILPSQFDFFFCRKNHDFPPSLSDYDDICMPTSKSDFLECLPVNLDGDRIKILYDSPDVDAYVIDGLALVQATTLKAVKSILRVL